MIAEALDALPRGLEPALRTKAEVHLVEQAAEFDPRDLARLGQRVLEVVAPEIAEEAEYQRLLAEERRNRKATRLFFRPRGDGSTDVNARVHDHVASRLRTYLDGYTSPRNKRLGEVDELPLSRRSGAAYCALLENLPSSGLPQQGSAATTVSVVIDYRTLLGDLGRPGVAVTSTGDRISADEARRMACQAGIIPFVMSGTSVILDQGRRKRLFDHHQRAALNLLYRSAPTSTARSRRPGPKPTTRCPGPRAAGPTWTTGRCCVLSTTTAPTTPAGSPATTPTAPPRSPDANRTCAL